MWWKQSESIHFDWITSDLFQVIWEYESALKDWTDKKWKTEFEQKMKAREYSDDICKVVWKELERFLIWRIEELERQKEEKEIKRLEQERQEKEEQEWQEEVERLARKELTPFEKILNEVFESYLNVIHAAFQWSDEDWHNYFEEKIIAGIREGTITKEDVPQIQKDLDAYIIKIRKDRDVYVKEMEIEKKKKEEQERLQREELEKMRQEETERKQRKAKQLPEVVELMDEYNFSQTNLKKEIC